MQTVNIKIDGMTCDGCVKSVEQALSVIQGVKKIKVDLEKRSATVSFAHSSTNTQALINAIEDAGFDASIND